MKYKAWPLKTYCDANGGWKIDGEYPPVGPIKTTKRTVIEDLLDADIMTDYDRCVAKVGTKRLDYNLVIVNEDTHEPLFGLRKSN